MLRSIAAVNRHWLRYIRVYIISFLLLAASFHSCRQETVIPAAGDPETHSFPEDVGNIFITRCATAGCHNEKSYTNAGDLLLDSWEHLFVPANNGAVVVPYSPEHSSLLYFINTHPDLGPVATPTMPLNGTPLSRDEYMTIHNWIASGAPDKNGNIPFAPDADTRQKIYITQQGCDLVAVLDARSKVIMRYITVGKTYPGETPGHIAMSPDGKYAYVCFWNGSYIQKINTTTDKVVGELDMGSGYMKTLLVSGDGNKLAVTSWYSQTLTVIDALTMQPLYTLGNGRLESPESIAANRYFDTFYVTAQFGNTIYKLAKGLEENISIDNKPATTLAATNTPDPYRILSSPDRSRYFVTCQNTNEVKILDAGNLTVQRSVHTEARPQEMAVCRSRQWLIVTCMGDTSNAAPVGAVQVIDYQAGQVIKTIKSKLFQPYGIAIDEQNGIFYVVNRNQGSKGPRPHHSSPCDGRNGYYMVFDLHTLEPVNDIRYEVSVDPYAAASRF